MSNTQIAHPNSAHTRAPLEVPLRCAGGYPSYKFWANANVKLDSRLSGSERVIGNGVLEC